TGGCPKRGRGVECHVAPRRSLAYIRGNFVHGERSMVNGSVAPERRRFYHSLFTIHQTSRSSFAQMARQFIYHMAGLSKAYGAKKVLDNIHLSFYPDAKIGILGPNGAGKSTVLRIMAGIDKEFTGE